MKSAADIVRQIAKAHMKLPGDEGYLLKVANNRTLS